MRRVMAGLVVIAFGIAVTGCAGTQPSVYAYPAKGQSAEQQSRDQNECQAWADRKSTRLNSSHIQKSRMPSSA